MKSLHSILRLVLGLVAVLLYSPLGAQSEVEPNNTFAQANAISLNMNVTGSINPANDDDYFKFTLTQPGVVTIAVNNVPSNIDMDFYLYGTNQQLISDDNFNNGENFSIHFLLCELGTYYIRLTDNEGNPAQYSMLVTLDISDVYECNPDIPSASQIAFNMPVMASIHPADDDDYFKFELTQPGVVTIAVNNVPSNVDMDFYLYGTNQQLISDDNFNNGENFSIHFLLCELGTYYIRLTDNEGNPAQYSMLVTLDTSDIYECNPDIPSASQIAFNMPVMASIHPADDNDYYKFELTQPGVVTIAVNNVPSNVDMDFYLYNTNQQLIYSTSSFNNGENFSLPFLLCELGTYYIQLTDNEGNPAQYSMLVTLDVSDVYECNPDIPSASQIAFNMPVMASIHPADDNDYYKFELTQPGVVTIAVSNVPSNIDMDFYLYGTNQQLIYSTSSFNNGENFSLSFLLCELGTYYIRLTDNEGNPAQYSMLVTLDTSDQYECNQDLNNASPITCNTPVAGSINPANDVDCYEVTLTQPNIITAQVTNVPVNQSLTVTLHGPEPSTQDLRRVNGSTGQSVTLVSPTTLQAGTYQVCITDNNTNAAQYQLNINCPSVVSTSEVPWANEVALYPNPTDGWLLLELPKTLSPNTVEYRIIDALGRVWLTRKAQGHEEQVDASLLPAGYYFLQLNTADGRLTRTFLRL